VRSSAAIRVPKLDAIAAGMPPAAWRLRLGADAFLTSDCTWEEYGRPSAELTLWEDRDFLHLVIEVDKHPRVHADPLGENRLDTWPAESHGDAVMIAMRDGAGRVHEWLVAADTSPPRGVHVRSHSVAPVTLDATVTQTPRGMRVDLGWSPADRVAALACAVTLRRPGSERRDGALVWPAQRGWVYGLGDRIGGSIPLVPIQRFHV
jgi:hypothetical protein